MRNLYNVYLNIKLPFIFHMNLFKQIYLYVFASV